MKILKHFLNSQSIPIEFVENWKRFGKQTKNKIYITLPMLSFNVIRSRQLCSAMNGFFAAFSRKWVQFNKNWFYFPYRTSNIEHIKHWTYWLSVMIFVHNVVVVYCYVADNVDTYIVFNVLAYGACIKWKQNNNNSITWKVFYVIRHNKTISSVEIHFWNNFHWNCLNWNERKINE